MGHESTTLFQQASVDIAADNAEVLFEFSTDLPGNTMTVRHGERLTAADEDPLGRRPINVRFSGTVRGRLFQVKVTPISGIAILRGMKLYARKLDRAGGATGWAWHTIPMEHTGLGWQLIDLPVPPTPDNYSEIHLPVPPTPDNYSLLDLRVPPTPDVYSDFDYPVRRGSATKEWVGLPMDD